MAENTGRAAMTAGILVAVIDGAIHVNSAEGELFIQFWLGPDDPPLKLAVDEQAELDPIRGYWSKPPEICSSVRSSRPFALEPL